MLDYQAMNTEEKHYKIWDTDYFVRLIPEKTFDSDKKESSFFRKLELVLSETSHYVSVKGRIEYRKNGFGSQKRRTGKFEEEWRDNFRGDSHHSLIIKLDDNPRKEILIGDVISDEGVRYPLREKALERGSGFFSGWKEVPFEDLNNQ